MIERTRIFSLLPGTPGRRQQIPRTIRSIWTPAKLAFELGSDGEYTPVAPGERRINAQEFFEIYMNKIFRSMKKGNDNDKVQILASKLLKES